MWPKWSILAASQVGRRDSWFSEVLETVGVRGGGGTEGSVLGGCLLSPSD